ncbi:3-hydroxyacyl-CoA dehydrogenase family protein [Ancylobacter polymorphus]|uniref:3-hydroxyacyl-CoA dehydrogenase family protein n=1 Tax=Ancylobacter polymorphus TaxID=223390 RepID=A0A9E7CYA3_9HYPH|nr:3-hydroxyacyl-CoA dehydrogenase family protein [Ancylobacter polymorphus]UOK73314.1 3-hydroxyacyl-CoA dehydrogenase family protein [Ancylobacter polymorphus]
MSKLSFRLVTSGESRSFPQGDAFHALADGTSGTVVLVGADLNEKAVNEAAGDASLIFVELDTQCLGEITGERMGLEGGKIVGFSRFRLGAGAPSQLIELVVQPHTDRAAKEAAVALFEAAGFTVSVCADRPGRIVDRLVRPYFNAVLNRIDDGLAGAADIDRAVTLGLGFKRGPVAWLEETGLDDHARVCNALTEAYADPFYRPARRARVAARRRSANDPD